MSARLTLIAHAIAAWLLAAVAAFLIVSYRFFAPAVGFVLMFVIGLGICYRVVEHELAELPSPSIQALRFLYQFGLGLMAIGLGGGLYDLFNWVLS